MPTRTSPASKKTALKPKHVGFSCPQCGAKPQAHGKGDCCYDQVECTGFLCECQLEENAEANQELIDREDHGESMANPCPHAACYHCGWFGKVPAEMPKGVLPWEKKALAAGWTPPKNWKKE